MTFDLDRHLVGRAANATRFDLEQWRGIAQRQIEDIDGAAAGLMLDRVQRGVDDALGQALLAAHHHLVHESRERPAPEPWIGRYFAFYDSRTTRHLISFEKPSAVSIQLSARLASGLADSRLLIAASLYANEPCSSGTEDRRTQAAFVQVPCRWLKSLMNSHSS